MYIETLYSVLIIIENQKKNKKIKGLFPSHLQSSNFEATFPSMEDFSLMELDRTTRSDLKKHRDA